MPNLNLRDFVLFIVDLKCRYFVSATCALATNATSRDIDIFNEKSVLLNDFLNSLCLLICTSVFHFLFSLWFVIHRVLFVLLFRMFSLHSCTVLVNVLFVLCQHLNNREFLSLVLSSSLSAASSPSSSFAFVGSVACVIGHLAVDTAFSCRYACIIILFPICFSL